MAINFLENSEKLTLRDIANSLISEPNRINLDDFFIWPPDLFALTSSILSLTGAYKFVFDPKSGSELIKKESIIELGQLWRKEMDNKNYANPINELSNLERGVLKIKREEGDFQKIIDRTIKGIKAVSYQDIFVVEKEKTINLNDLKIQLEGKMDSQISSLHDPENLDKDFRKVLIDFHHICDEFSAGFGIRSNSTLHLKFYKDFNSNRLRDKGMPFIYTFCENVSKSLLKHNGSLSRISSGRCRILPKRHTPQTGITLRSITAYLSYHRSSVKVTWNFYSGNCNPLFMNLCLDTIDKIKNKQKINFSSLSILLIPWPFEIHGTDIIPTDDNTVNELYGFFKYAPKNKSEMKDSQENNLEEKDTHEKSFEIMLEEYIQKAKKEHGKVDLIVFPETALDDDLCKILVHKCLDHNISGYITGIRKYNTDKNVLGTNHVQMQFFNYDEDKPENIKEVIKKAIIQNKHHRWRLDEHQIKKYNLGASLATSKNWWEGIEVKDREVNFFNIGEELTMCTLICEDLARQDPIADLIRSVGPNLVFALLMDGEQLKFRWSARYASILSDDPGSTVITLTSLGMINRHSDSKNKSQKSIGLVSDNKGNFSEITLPSSDKKAALITLNLIPENEKLVGRPMEYCYTNQLTLGGIFYM